MKQITADLWQTSLYQSGMLSSHAYFLQTEQGNVLIYNTNDQSDLAHMHEMGGIDYQLLTHRDEAAPSLSMIKEQFASKLVCTDKEFDAISQYAKADVIVDQARDKLYGIDLLLTPGHTDGSMCFYYQSPHGGNYLFTGDTIFQEGK